MNTSTPLDPRSLALRLTTVGHALQHRLFAQLRDGGIHPKAVLVLSALDGRIDAPWISARLARGGKRIDALVSHGWITRDDEGWALTDEGRAVLDRVDAARAALLADVPVDELRRLTTALDAVSAAVGLEESDTSEGPHAARGVGPGADRRFGPFGRGSAPGMRGFGPRFGPRAHAFGPREHDRRGLACGEHDRGGTHHAHDGRGFAHTEHDGRGAHRRGHRHDDHRSTQRAYERGFDAGFRRGRESSASGDAPASA